MSNDAQKADQIAFHFYTKLFFVVNDARATAESSSRIPSKVDKWFNLEIPDSDLFTREARERYKSISMTGARTPPLEIQVLLAIPELNSNQVLVYLPPPSSSASRIQIKPTPTHILLERWLLTFDATGGGISGAGGLSGEVALPTIYKHGIPLFRSLYSLLRILPAWKLCKRLRRRPNHLSISLRIRGGEPIQDDGILYFDTPLAPHIPPLSTQTHVFPSVPHPLGTLTISATCLSTPSFRIDELESFLSSRFLGLDVEEGPEWVPTLVKNQQRDSIAGSLPRASLGKTPEGSAPGLGGAAAVERFILPPRASTSLTGTGSSPRTTSSPIPSPPDRAIARIRKESITSVGLARSASSSVSTSLIPVTTNPSTLPTGVSSSSLHTKEGSTADLPGPLPIPLRRPPLNPVNPFKTSALTISSTSSSLSLKQSSTAPGISGSPSLRAGSLGTASGTTTVGSGTTRFPSTGAAMSTTATPPSPLSQTSNPKPSPPQGAPSSPLSKADSGGSADSGGGTVRKRYSSSFGHRYNNPSAGGGLGGVGSGTSPSGSPHSPGSASGTVAPAALTSSPKAVAEGVHQRRTSGSGFLETTTDDDDISEFVKDIDRARPLTGRQRVRPRASSSTHSLSLPLGDEPDSPSAANVPTPLLFSPDREPPLSSSSSPRFSSLTGRTSASRLSSLNLGLTSPLSEPDRPVMEGLDVLGLPTTESEIDEKLRIMNDAFLKSIEGLGSSSSGSSGSTSGNGKKDKRPVLPSTDTITSPPPPASISGGVGTVAAMMLRDRRESLSAVPAPPLHSPSYSASPSRQTFTPSKGSPLIQDISLDSPSSASGSGSFRSFRNSGDRERILTGVRGGGLGTIGRGQSSSEEIIGPLEFES